MVAYVSDIGETSEHTAEVVSQTADTIRAVLDGLVLIGGRIVQFDGVGYIECTIQVEIMLVVIRVVLHRFHIVVSVRETYVVTFRTVGQR